MDKKLEESELKFREILGNQMVANLIAIAELENKPISQMEVDEHGVFHEIEIKYISSRTEVDQKI